MPICYKHLGNTILCIVQYVQHSWCFGRKKFTWTLPTSNHEPNRSKTLCMSNYQVNVQPLDYRGFDWNRGGKNIRTWEPINPGQVSEKKKIFHLWIEIKWNLLSIILACFNSKENNSIPCDFYTFEFSGLTFIHTAHCNFSHLFWIQLRQPDLS
jgi:hypothetical protein